MANANRLRRAAPDEASSCGNWVPYFNEKCLHIVDNAVFQTKHEAEIVCQSLAEILGLDDIPRLVTISTEKEQKALERFLFEEVGLLEPVWLGLNREDDGVFRWNNGADMDFNNLAKQTVSDADRPCVQMESGQGTFPVGQWVRVNCRKRNVVVCEKLQVWTIAKLQSNFINLKLQIDKQAGRQQNLVGAASRAHGRSSVVPFEKSPCGSWSAYKDESCITLVDGTGAQTKEGADLVCQTVVKETEDGQVAKLVTVKNEEKQKFINEILFEKQATYYNVWLGLELGEEDSIFRWNDGSELSFTNWEIQADANKNRRCVHMESGQGISKAGQWVRANCNMQNGVVCERPQSWSVEKLENALKNLKVELERKHEESEAKINAVKEEAKRNITILMDNAVPIGFIYVQLPEQASPTLLWPHMTWTEVTQDYAGLFFRVSGGSAAPFGQRQKDNTRNLIAINNAFSGGSGSTDPLPVNGNWSNYVLTGATIGKSISLRFRFNPGEVRPINTAVKIWRRIR